MSKEMFDKESRLWCAESLKEILTFETFKSYLVTENNEF